MKRVVVSLVVSVLLVGLLVWEVGADPGTVEPSRSRDREPLPFTFFLTHYELLGDPNNPTGVRYNSNGRPFALNAEGHKLTLIGKGAWDPASARATGGGRYIITNPSGGVLDKGTWGATRFISFEMLPGWWGIPGFEEKGWQGPPGSASFSGFLKVRVRLEGLGRGVLTAWCLMPEVPKPGDHISDGISLRGPGFRFTDYHGTERSLEGVMFYSPGQDDER
jgi:hypothetical protein